MVGVWIFNPDPERLASLSMCAVVPLESAKNLKHNAQHSACDWLDGCLNVQQWNLTDTVFDPCTHVDMADHMTYTMIMQNYLSNPLLTCATNTDA